MLMLRAAASVLTVRPAARRSGLSPSACNSTRNAGSLAGSTQLVRVTHPFHPLSGRLLICVGERYNRSGKRLLLRVDDATVCSIPPQWTDAVCPDPEVLIGQGRALFRVADLMELASLVARLSPGKRMGVSTMCKVISAACVSRTTPQTRKSKGSTAQSSEQAP
jgi:Family of unknown function (DUF5372)